MNRRKRRKSASNGRVTAPTVFGAIAAGYECPDCTADTVLANPSAGVYVLEVRHDETCPWLRRLES